MSRHEFLQAGQFSVRLNVEKEVETADGCGGFETIWTAQFDIWAKLVPVSAAVVRTADNEHGQLTHYIYIRKAPGIESGMRFVKGARKFLINTVQDPDETGRYLVCLAREEQ